MNFFSEESNLKTTGHPAIPQHNGDSLAEGNSHPPQREEEEEEEEEEEDRHLHPRQKKKKEANAEEDEDEEGVTLSPPPVSLVSHHLDHPNREELLSTKAKKPHSSIAIRPLSLQPIQQAENQPPRQPHELQHRGEEEEEDPYKSCEHADDFQHQVENKEEEEEDDDDEEEDSYGGADIFGTESFDTVCGVDILDSSYRPAVRRILILWCLVLFLITSRLIVGFFGSFRYLVSTGALDLSYNLWKEELFLTSIVEFVLTCGATTAGFLALINHTRLGSLCKVQSFQQFFTWCLLLHAASGLVCLVVAIKLTTINLFTLPLHFSSSSSSSLSNYDVGGRRLLPPERLQLYPTREEQEQEEEESAKHQKRYGDVDFSALKSRGSSSSSSSSSSSALRLSLSPHLLGGPLTSSTLSDSGAEFIASTKQKNEEEEEKEESQTREREKESSLSRPEAGHLSLLGHEKVVGEGREEERKENDVSFSPFLSGKGRDGAAGTSVLLSSSISSLSSSERKNPKEKAKEQQANGEADAFLSLLQKRRSPQQQLSSTPTAAGSLGREKSNETAETRSSQNLLQKKFFQGRKKQRGGRGGGRRRRSDEDTTILYERIPTLAHSSRDSDHSILLRNAPLLSRSSSSSSTSSSSLFFLPEPRSEKGDLRDEESSSGKKEADVLSAPLSASSFLHLVVSRHPSLPADLQSPHTHDASPETSSFSSLPSSSFSSPVETIAPEGGGRSRAPSDVLEPFLSVDNPEQIREKESPSLFSSSSSLSSLGVAAEETEKFGDRNDFPHRGVVPVVSTERKESEEEEEKDYERGSEEDEGTRRKGGEERGKEKEEEERGEISRHLSEDDIQGVYTLQAEHEQNLSSPASGGGQGREEQEEGRKRRRNEEVEQGDREKWRRALSASAAFSSYPQHSLTASPYRLGENKEEEEEGTKKSENDKKREEDPPDLGSLQPSSRSFPLESSLYRRMLYASIPLDYFAAVLHASCFLTSWKLAETLGKLFGLKMPRIPF